MLKYYRIEGGNFGDDINLQLWPLLFPDFAILKKIVVYGVGTLLDGEHDRTAMKVVLGTGMGAAGRAQVDQYWDFRWVRGPRTAAGFGLSNDLALGDAAILWPELTTGHDLQGPIGLIPHYATWDSYDWVSVAVQAGMVAINPRSAPNVVIEQLRRCSRVMTESLHGAICADAMGIPWAVCVLAHRFNEFKWRDWLATVNRPYAALVMDRPLVRSITLAKGCANRLARTVGYRRYTRYPALRPVAPATAADALSVARSLRDYAKYAANFACSDAERIARQRRNMLLRCAEFANDYKLEFSPTQSPHCLWPA